MSVDWYHGVVGLVLWESPGDRMNFIAVLVRDISIHGSNLFLVCDPLADVAGEGVFVASLKEAVSNLVLVTCVNGASGQVFHA